MGMGRPTDLRARPMSELDPAALDAWITGDPDNPPPDYRCPECGSEEISDAQGHLRPDGDDRPPFELYCEKCEHEWSEE